LVPPLRFNEMLLIAMAISAWPCMAVGAWRCHDRGRSGWFQLVTLIPIAGQIWLFIELGLLRGTKHQNRYGADPTLRTS
jgi:uncharacterized membrane protein YhaH (DUF805 family)